MVYQVDKRKVSEVCDILKSEFECRKLDTNDYQFRRVEGGNINVYRSGKIVIQGPDSSKEKLRALFEKICGHVLNHGSEKVENMVLTNDVPIDIINYLQQGIDRLCARKGYQKGE